MVADSDRQRYDGRRRPADSAAEEFVPLTKIPRLGEKPIQNHQSVTYAVASAPNNISASSDQSLQNSASLHCHPASAIPLVKCNSARFLFF